MTTPAPALRELCVRHPVIRLRSSTSERLALGVGEAQATAAELRAGCGSPPGGE
jgi:hypothetical protein